MRKILLILNSLLPFFLYGDTAAFSSLEDEYTPKYCLQLEAAYGDGLMSEGGQEGIDYMFDQIPLEGKRALDIGSGIGGAAFYLADRYAMHITGLEVNSWLVEESKRRIPGPLKNQVDFLLSTSNSHWPLSTSTYDIIYSKGVLTIFRRKMMYSKNAIASLKKMAY